MKIYKNNKIIFESARFSGPSGLMFKTKPKPNEAIIMALEKESKLGSSIHMFFVFYSIYVVWLDKDRIIVDIKQVFPFQPISIPSKPAMYILECSIKPNLSIGDKISF